MFFDRTTPVEAPEIYDHRFWYTVIEKNLDRLGFGVSVASGKALKTRDDKHELMSFRKLTLYLFFASLIAFQLCLFYFYPILVSIG